MGHKDRPLWRNVRNMELMFRSLRHKVWNMRHKVCSLWRNVRKMELMFRSLRHKVWNMGHKVCSLWRNVQNMGPMFLEGVVDSEADKNLAGIRENGVHGVF